MVLSTSYHFGSKKKDKNDIVSDSKFTINLNIESQYLQSHQWPQFEIDNPTQVFNDKVNDPKSQIVKHFGVISKDN